MSSASEVISLAITSEDLKDKRVFLDFAQLLGLSSHPTVPVCTAAALSQPSIQFTMQKLVG
jgi:hypothetical protein